MRNARVWWQYINELILNNHGPLENILTTYTLAHVNHFLQEIDNRARRKQIENIYDLRIAQAELKGFKEAIRKLRQNDLQIRRAQARAEGRRLELEPSEYEQEVLDSQRHDYFSDWNSQEQERFKNQQSAMWDLIPPEFRANAERLARGQ